MNKSLEEIKATLTKLANDMPETAKALSKIIQISDGQLRMTILVAKQRDRLLGFRTRTASRLRNERAKNRRKDEEIRLLRVIIDELENDNGQGPQAYRAARAALAEFDRGKHGRVSKN